MVSNNYLYLFRALKHKNTGVLYTAIGPAEPPNEEMFFELVNLKTGVVYVYPMGRVVRDFDYLYDTQR
jgi:hypothetical protein